MRDLDRQTRSHLMNVFEEKGFHPRTDLGQNFLIDLNLVEYVVDQAELNETDVVLEVGTGTGGMTSFLAQSAGAVISVEIDRRMHELASEALASYPNVTLLLCDALKNKNHFAPAVLEAVDRELAANSSSRLKLVANLPYCIATPVISNLVASELPWSRMVVTIQWELAERMRAQPNTSEYGALSVWLQSQCQVKVLKKLGPTVFWPRPQVDSAVVRLLPAPNLRAGLADRGFFHDFIRRLFHLRRKALRTVLVGMYRKQLTKPQIDEVMIQEGFKEGLRAEELDVTTLAKLSETIRQMMPPGE